MKKPSKEELEIRREKVKKLLVRCLTIEEIAKALNVSPRTIRRDKTVIKRKILKKIKKEPIEGILFKMSLESNAVLREAWRNYYSNEALPKDKNISLRIIMESIEKQSRIMSNLGLIEKKLVLDIDNEVVVRFIKPEWKENGDKNKVSTPPTPEEVS